MWLYIDIIKFQADLLFLNIWRKKMRKGNLFLILLLMFPGILLFADSDFNKPNNEITTETKSLEISKQAQQKFKPGQWVGIHLFAPWHNEMPLFTKTLKEKIFPMGFNVLVLEVNYKLKFESHPELREKGNNLTKEDAKVLADLCKKYNVKLIPLFNCLGHQSWAENNFPLITQYPELDETPNIPKDNKTIYCRSWCPLHPKTNKLVFKLFDELVDAFGSDSFHIGMDEVFLIGHEQCPRCKGKNPAELYAKAVNDYYNYLTKEKNVKDIYIWGDRLIDMKEVGYGDYEASNNGTAPAADMIPKDIIICDWHYEKNKEYLSVNILQKKGFRVIPSTWRNYEATELFINYAKKHGTDKMIGHLFTTWVGAQEMCPAFMGEKLNTENHKMAEEVAETTEKAIKLLYK